MLSQQVVNPILLSRMHVYIPKRRIHFNDNIMAISGCRVDQLSHSINWVLKTRHRKDGVQLSAVANAKNQRAYHPKAGDYSNEIGSDPPNSFN